MPLRCLMERLGVGRKTIWLLERQGLRGVTIGKQRYFLGDAVCDFFARLAEEAAAVEEEKNRD